MAQENKEQQANDQEKVQIAPPEVADNATEQAALRDENGQPLAKGPREVLYERIRTSRPDGNYDDDEEEYFRQASDIIDALEGDSKRYKDLKEQLANRFNENPEEANVLLDYLEGMPLLASIRKNMGDEALSIKEGDDGWDEYQKAGEERQANYKRNLDLAEEVKNNSKLSDEEFTAWAKENNLDEEQQQAVWNLIQGDMQNVIKGKLSKDIFNRYRSALNHDKDVEKAGNDGEVRGRNAAIDAQRKKMSGSGLPNGNAGGNTTKTVDQELDPREEMARQFAMFKRR